MSKFTQKDIDILEEEVVFEQYLQVKRYRLKHQLFEGGWSSPIDRECLMRPQAVTVLPYDPWADKIILVEQIRIGAMSQPSPWIVEVVAGLVEPGETPAEVARRELLEESGAHALHLEHVFDYFTSPGCSAEKLSLFSAVVDVQNVSGIHGRQDEGEDIRVHVVAADQVADLLTSGEIIAAPTLIALQWFSMQRPVLKQRFEERGKAKRG